MKSVDKVVQEMEDIQIERAGFESRNGFKTFDYCAQRYRYWCGECQREVEREGHCECGWSTSRFTEVGI